ncbi:MAG: hypothetical protein KGJ59_12485 [Bacteroidota bacterium]|nr:hypothetical protein [Bacteroidota bacterium]
MKSATRLLLSYTSFFFITTQLYSQPPTNSAQSQQAPLRPASETPSLENSTLISIFPKFDVAVDSLLSQISGVENVTPNIRTLIIYKVKVHWPFKEQLTYSELQFLVSYFEQRLKNALTEGRRFAVSSSQDLKTLSFRATDSTLQVKNTYSEEELRNYAHQRGIDGIVNADVLISPNKIMMFVNINDLSGITVWSKEMSAEYRVLPMDATKELEREYELRRKTGLIENFLSVGFQVATRYQKGVKDTAGSYGYYSLGYRINEMATILDFLKFYIDGRVIGTSDLGLMGFIVQPGFSFEVIGNEAVGPGLLLLDVSGGFDISFKNGISELYGGGLSLRLSRNIGITGLYNFIIVKNNFARSDLGGPIYGLQVNFVL